MTTRKISEKHYQCEKISDAYYEDDTLYFTFSGTAREANVLRRIFIRDIPVMAISDVKFRQNYSVFHDEFLEERLRLIPVMVDADDFKDDENISFTVCCKGSKHPIVFSEHFKSTQGKYTLMPNIALIKMNNNHIIELEAIATKGYGRNHASFQAVTISVFKKVDENTFKFTVESIGVYTPKKILKKALKIYV